MKSTTRGSFKSLFVALSLLGAATAYGAVGDPDIDMDTGAIPGSTTDFEFTYDDVSIDAQGVGEVTQEDTDDDGVLSAGDEFQEFTLIAVTGFSQNDSQIVGTGIQNDYQMFIDFTLDGFISFDGSDLQVTFTSGTADWYYDEALDGVINGTEVDIATLSLALAPTSGCDLGPVAADISGSCILYFDFDADFDNIFVSAFGDLNGYVGDLFRVDVNVDQISGLSNVFAGYGVTCGAGSDDTTSNADGLCTQGLEVDHDGSGRHIIPAPSPGTITLMGLGLLLLAHRTRQAKV